MLGPSVRIELKATPNKQIREDNKKKKKKNTEVKTKKHYELYDLIKQQTSLSQILTKYIPEHKSEDPNSIMADFPKLIFFVDSDIHNLMFLLCKTHISLFCTLF